MKAEHPPEANPNRGYSYVGLENVGAIRRDGKITRDIKVSSSTFSIRGPPSPDCHC